MGTDSKNSKGIIQLVNKSGGSFIGEDEKSFFKDLGNLIGNLVEMAVKNLKARESLDSIVGGVKGFKKVLQMEDVGNLEGIEGRL